jgi:hypothetical protein
MKSIGMEQNGLSSIYNRKENRLQYINQRTLQLEAFLKLWENIDNMSLKKTEFEKVIEWIYLATNMKGVARF